MLRFIFQRDSDGRRELGAVIKTSKLENCWINYRDGGKGSNDFGISVTGPKLALLATRLADKYEMRC